MSQPLSLRHSKHEWSGWRLRGVKLNEPKGRVAATVFVCLRFGKRQSKLTAEEKKLREFAKPPKFERITKTVKHRE